MSVGEKVHVLSVGFVPRQRWSVCLMPQERREAPRSLLPTLTLTCSQPRGKISSLSFSFLEKHTLRSEQETVWRGWNIVGGGCCLGKRLLRKCGHPGLQGVESNHRLQKNGQVFMLVKHSRPFNTRFYENWVGHLPYRNVWYIWHLQVRVCEV